ncbi:probable F420-dependent oxidoreductase, Rv2161c family [Nocardia amikacinitolerans]|uniref:Probable F420-dependent oxidoreductase, Rv2161c family n=1 Tax=Nocardia amikacinitolerans TaxID=756689 RepID=A0A285KS87_9NOCA|nr:LLM class F420-dependent oxidoreductase [Nocardia amikacinitolerans]SNY75489.1 probable F420-dependent oxidoreductase, Rv2161c family [Nocardia amikacinitolerans]
MRYGIVLFTSDRGITPADAAAAAERAGFDSFYVPEHTHIPVVRAAAHPRTGDASLPDDRYLRTLDPWVALGTAAAVTERITLSTAVALPAEHHPITLAKAIASLDHLSGGRVSLGVGFGWNTDELAHHGVPANKRRTVLREHLDAMRAIWSEEEASFSGEFVNFGPSWSWPKPTQKRIPVLLGAAGGEKSFTWLAKNADGWITTPTEEGLGEKIELLHRIWREHGRTETPEIIALAGRHDAAQLAQWAELGVTEAVFGLPDRDAEEVRAYLERLAGKLGMETDRR